MKNVVMVINGLYPGGAEKQFCMLASGLNKNKFNVEVVTLYGVGDLGPKLESEGVKVTYLNKDINPLNCSFITGLIASIKAYFKLRKLIKNVKPAIVHSFLPHANIIARFAGRGSKVISAIRVKEIDYKWQVKLDKLTKGMVDVYTTNSYEVQAFTHELLDIDDKKTKVIYNGIDFSKYENINVISAREKFGVVNKKVITMIANFRDQKDHNSLIEAMTYLGAMFNGNIVCLLAGTGSESSINEIKNYIKKIGVSDKVKLLGYRDDVPELLAASNVVVLATKYEGSPNAIIEAMASKRPVVASRIPEVEEIINTDKFGLLVEPGKPLSYGMAIEALLTSPVLSAEIADNAYNKVVKLFGKQRMIDEHEKLYEELLNEK